MNPPDPKTKTKTPRGKLILEGIGEQNEPANWEGRKGFWVQGDCLFIEAGSPQAAIAAYRKEIVATSHNHFCGSIMREKDRFRADALELENQSLTRRLEEANKLAEAADDDADAYQAKLTALRTAAEGARDALADMIRGAQKQNWQDNYPQEINAAYKALAALRAELDQADSNASNSPTASRQSQG